MTTDVLFEEMPAQSGALGIITLNRPAVLNSLNYAMIMALTSQLQAWQAAAHIKAVIIRATPGRAFCAGGDIRLTWEKMVARQPGMADFFRDEYALNQMIYHYPKPYIALLDGITMGGGVGISIHGSHRVATEKLTFAMPETGIGFFPDVGGTYFLPRLEARFGYYLGLTGSKIACDDCVHLGIANLKVDQESLPALLDSLSHACLTGDAYAAVSEVLASYAQPLATSRIMAARAAIEQAFAKDSIEEILQRLQQSEHDICREAAVSLLKKSPTSLKVTLAALRRGEQLDFDHCMQQEFQLVNTFLQGHDFAEGIRAVIIDKDQQPKWDPKSLQEVSTADVARYFQPLRKTP